MTLRRSSKMGLSTRQSRATGPESFARIRKPSDWSEQMDDDEFLLPGETLLFS
jgi:hypothetical protein